MSQRVYYSEQARQRARLERTFIAVFFMGLGLSIGTVIALLFAPDEGEVIREDIAERADDAFTRARENAAHLRENVEDGLESVRN